MCIRDRYQRRVRGTLESVMEQLLCERTPSYHPEEHHAAPINIRWTTRNRYDEHRWVFLRCCGQTGILGSDGCIRSRGSCLEVVPETMHSGGVSLHRTSRTNARKASSIATWKCCGQHAVIPQSAPTEWTVEGPGTGCEQWDPQVAQGGAPASTAGSRCYLTVAQLARPILNTPEALPVLGEPLLSISAEVSTAQPPGASQSSKATPEREPLAGVFVPPNLGYLGEEFAVKWFESQGYLVEWCNSEAEAHGDHDLRIRMHEDTNGWTEVEVKTRWSGCAPKSNQISSRQRERLQEPEARFMLMVIGDAGNLFQNPPTSPRIKIYKPPSYKQAWQQEREQRVAAEEIAAAVASEHQELLDRATKLQNTIGRLHKELVLSQAETESVKTESRRHLAEAGKASKHEAKAEPRETHHDQATSNNLCSVDSTLDQSTRRCAFPDPKAFTKASKGGRGSAEADEMLMLCSASGSGHNKSACTDWASASRCNGNKPTVVQAQSTLSQSSFPALLEGDPMHCCPNIKWPSAAGPVSHSANATHASCDPKPTNPQQTCKNKKNKGGVASKVEGATVCSPLIMF
eukprot:TRINITY_DN95_c0_g1_i2.p1 TRINITY_DN95_c0_g1~~TRINITY_DN95_c0_g1_i2.p1  ORF type:complete len:574 (+),score=58.96 TRINITY_DN95_c0_g1_i2:174-1895(+)